MRINTIRKFVNMMMWDGKKSLAQSILKEVCNIKYKCTVHDSIVSSTQAFQVIKTTQLAR